MDTILELVLDSDIYAWLDTMAYGTDSSVEFQVHEILRRAYNLDIDMGTVQDHKNQAFIALLDDWNSLWGMTSVDADMVVDQDLAKGFMESYGIHGTRGLGKWLARNVGRHGSFVLSSHGVGRKAKTYTVRKDGG